MKEITVSFKKLSPEEQEQKQLSIDYAKDLDRRYRKNLVNPYDKEGIVCALAGSYVFAVNSGDLDPIMVLGSMFSEGYKYNTQVQDSKFLLTETDLWAAFSLWEIQYYRSTVMN